MAFNSGKPYGGIETTNGRLIGATDTDYFYFFCPKCPDKEIMRILEYGEHERTETNKYDATCKSKTKYGFTLAFKLHCEKCGLTDFVKVSNIGRQGGKYSDFLGKS